jgi:hypothetical protein
MILMGRWYLVRLDLCVFDDRHVVCDIAVTVAIDFDVVHKTRVRELMMHDEQFINYAQNKSPIQLYAQNVGLFRWIFSVQFVHDNFRIGRRYLLVRLGLGQWCMRWKQLTNNHHVIFIVDAAL